MAREVLRSPTATSVGRLPDSSQNAPPLRDNLWMDLQRLREDTRPEHEATEAAMPLFNSELTLETYKRILRTLLPLLRSWEIWAAGAAPASLQSLLPARRRSPMLVADLHALGDLDVPEKEPEEEPEAAAVNWTAVACGDAAERDGGLSGDAFRACFLGSLYVMEGSTLGGTFIARQVQSVFGFSGGQGDAYFRGHGEATGALWRETTAVLAAIPEEDADLVTGAARRTFAVFGAALRELAPLEPAQTIRR